MKTPRSKAGGGVGATLFMSLTRGTGTTNLVATGDFLWHDLGHESSLQEISE